MLVSRAAGRVAMLVALAVCFPCPAWAHKLNVFAHVEGHIIRGTAYFPGNVPAQGAQVTALSPDGRELGRTTSDREGNFALQARVRSDTKIVATTEDGHGAEYVLHAAELPADLPAAEEGDRPDLPRPAVGTSPGAPTEGRSRPKVGPDGNAAGKGAGSSLPPGGPSIAGGELLAQIEALRAQVVELRGQVYDYEQRLRFRDVLGGLGYILGVAGVACYLLSLNRPRAPRE
jgi:nickel transport protein